MSREPFVIIKGRPISRRDYDFSRDAMSDHLHETVALPADWEDQRERWKMNRVTVTPPGRDG